MSSYKFFWRIFHIILTYIILHIYYFTYCFKKYFFLQIIVKTHTYMLDRLKKNDNSRKNFHKFKNWRKIFLYRKIVSINTSSFSVENYFDRVTFHDLSIATLRFLGSQQRKYPCTIFLLLYDDKIVDDNLFQTKIPFKFRRN